MMKLIAITQRSDNIHARDETRDALDQRWWLFLNACGLTPLILPNELTHASDLLSKINVEGVLLTGGSHSPTRESIENYLLDFVQQQQLPLLGVCHGMQQIQKFFGISLEKISHHVCAEQEIFIHNKLTIVNSYHDYGTTVTNPLLTVWARAHDGIVKAIKHDTLPIFGIMWHPERMMPFAQQDIELMQNIFLGSKK